MIRRALLLVAAAALLVLTPSVAIAAPSYAAPGYTVTVTDATPASGQCTTMTVTGGAANAGNVYTLNATGPSTTSLTATANASGAASFQVCLTKVGDYTLTVTNSDGAVVATQTITVHSATAGGDDTDGNLSQTGSNVLPFALGGVLLVLLGVGAVVVARRRHEPAMHS